MSMPSTNNYGYRPTNKFSIKPNQLRFALYVTAVVFGAFGKVIAPGGSGVVIGSQSNHRLTVDAISQKTTDNLALLMPEELLELPWIKEMDDSFYAYQISKRGNALRVVSEAVKWGKRGARVNCISAGIVYTP